MMKLKIENLYKDYNNNHVLDNINFSLNESEIVFIVGKSGSGKSTLLSIIGGMEKESKGSIIFTDGIKNKVNSDSSFKAFDVGFIFQDYNLIMGLSVLDNIKICLGYSKIKYSDNELKKRISGIGLKKPNQIVDTLSGGEKQRVAILRASLKQAKVILADEPTGNLDSQNSIKVFNELVRLKRNRIVLVVTHDMDAALNYADRIITLSDGKIVSDVKNKDNIEQNDNEIVYQYMTKKSYNIVKLMINSMKKHKIRSLSFLLILVLCIVLLSVSLNLYTNAIDINDNLNVNYLETDLVSIMYDKDDYGMYQHVGERPIDEALLNNLSNDSLVSHFVEKYGNSNYYLSYNNTSCEANIREVSIDEYFNNRYSSFDINGEFIKNKYDIVIGLNEANTIFGEEDPIGKEIKINDGNGYFICLNVVGVNKTISVSGEYLTLVSNDVIKELVEEEYSKESTVEIARFSRTDIIGINNSIIGRGNLVENNKPKNVILGSDIIDSNDILISSIIYSYLSDLDKESLFIDKFYIKLASTMEVNIVGVYEDTLPNIIVENELISNLLVAKPTSLNIYLNDYNKITEFSNSIKGINDKLLISSTYENLKNNVSKTTKTTQDIMLVIAIVFFLVSIIMMYSYMKLIMIEKTYEIGILKSFGASNKNIFVNIISDIMSIMISAIVISFALTPLANLFITSFIDSNHLISLSYPAVYLSSIAISFILLALLCAILEMIKYRKKSISQLLREKNI